MGFALVNIRSKTPSKKLAILKNYLKGDLADIVHGHGGGKAGYKEVLQRLKSTRGSRKVIRATHLRELNRMRFNCPIALVSHNVFRKIIKAIFTFHIMITEIYIAP